MKNLSKFLICLLPFLVSDINAVEQNSRRSKNIPILDSFLSITARNIYPYHFKEQKYIYYRFNYKDYKKLKKVDNNYTYVVLSTKEKVNNTYDLSKYITYTFLSKDFHKVKYDDFEQNEKIIWKNSEFVYKNKNKKIYPYSYYMKVFQNHEDINNNTLIIRVQEVPNIGYYEFTTAKCLPTEKCGIKKSKTQIIYGGGNSQKRIDRREYNKKNSDYEIGQKIGIVLFGIWVYLFVLYFVIVVKKKNDKYCIIEQNNMPYYNNI